MTSQQQRKTGTSAVSSPPPRKKAPIQSIRDMLDIEKHFNEQILDQPTSIRRLSSTLSDMVFRREALVPIVASTIAEEEQVLLYTIALVGPSGTGKNTTVRCLRHFLGMDEGYEFEHQFIEMTASPLEGSQESFMYGNHGASSASSRDGLAIINHLNNGLKNTPLPNKEAPPYLMLLLHDFENAPYSFKLTIDNLIRTARLALKNAQFKLPRATALFIVCTCHYGADSLMEMSLRCDDAAREYIRRAMIRSVPDTTIQRINLLLPYYPLAHEVFELLLGKKLDAYINSSSIVKRMGASALCSTPEMKKMLIKHVLNTLDKRSGMHGGERILKDKVNVLFETGISVIDRMQQEKKRMLNEKIYLDAFSLDTRLFGEMLGKELDKVTGTLIQSMKENPVNKQQLAKCDPTMNGTVEAVGMRYGEIPLCGLIMNVTYVTINNYYEGDEATESLKERLRYSKEENKKLKGCLLAVTAAVEKDQHDKIDGIIRKSQQLLHESSDDSHDDVRHAICHKRKAAAAAIATSHSDIGQMHKRPRIDETSTIIEEEEVILEEEEERPLSPFHHLFADDEAEYEERIKRERRRLDSDDDQYDDLYLSEEDELLFSSDEPDYLDCLLDESESEEEEEEADPSVTMPVEQEKKRGRPCREIEGFIRIVNRNSPKAPLWECIQCHIRLTKVIYTKNHRCKK